MVFSRGYSLIHVHLRLLKHLSPLKTPTCKHDYVFWNFIRLSSYNYYETQIDVRRSRDFKKVTPPAYQYWNNESTEEYTPRSDAAKKKLLIKHRNRRLINVKQHLRRKPESIEYFNMPKIHGQVIYGIHPIHIALQARRRTFHKLYMESSLLESEGSDTDSIVFEIRKMAREKMIPIEVVSEEILGELVMDPNQTLRKHQGICGDVSLLKYILFDEKYLRSVLADMTGPPQIWLMLQSVQDPHNFGAVIRSAHYLGIDRIVAHNCCKLSTALSNISAGSIEVPLVYHTDYLEDLLQVCRSDDWQILGTTGSSVDGVVSVDKVSVDKNTIILLGNEGVGLTEDICALCDAMITIPHNRNHIENTTVLDSLNVSVAAGIIMHRLLRGRS